MSCGPRWRRRRWLLPNASWCRRRRGSRIMGWPRGQAPFDFSTGRATRPASVVVESRGVRPCSTSTASTITASPSTRELTWISTLVEPVLKEIDAGWPTFAKIRGASRTFPTASVTRTQLMTISLTLSSSTIPSSTKVASTAIAAICGLDAVSPLDVLKGCREWHAVAMQRPREAIARTKACGRCMLVKTSHRPVDCAKLRGLVWYIIRDIGSAPLQRSRPRG